MSENAVQIHLWDLYTSIIYLMTYDFITQVFVCVKNRFNNSQLIYNIILTNIFFQDAIDVYTVYILSLSTLYSQIH